MRNFFFRVPLSSFFSLVVFLLQSPGLIHTGCTTAMRLFVRQGRLSHGRVRRGEGGTGTQRGRGAHGESLLFFFMWILFCFFSCSLFFLEGFLLQSHAHPHWVRQGRLFICVLRRWGRCTKRGRSRKGQEQARWCNSMFVGWSVCVCRCYLMCALSPTTPGSVGTSMSQAKAGTFIIACARNHVRRSVVESDVVHSHSRSHIRFQVAVGSRRQSIIGVLYCR